jgi:hypothetical protein
VTAVSESKASLGFPYDHLAVLGFKKLQRYVPTTAAGDKVTQSSKLTVTVNPDGTTKVSNDRTEIFIYADGTVDVSSEDPIELSGASLAKLDDPSIGGPHGATSLCFVLEALAKRLNKRA